MNFKKKLIPILVSLSIAISTAYGFVSSTHHFEYSALEQTQQPTAKKASASKDTTPRFPINNQAKKTYDDLNKEYPMDLKNPENVKTIVEYDVRTGNYIIRTKVGDVEVSTPYTLTPEEYRKYTEQQELNRYWRELNTSKKKNNEDKFSVTDMKFSLGPMDKIFGPGGVQLKTSGQAELTFGFKNNFINNPALTEKARRSNIPNFDQKIQMNVTGKVGDKINFGMNYNTDASFDFDQKMIKLNYKGKEDDIIQSIEAGNVSMQLNSALITGSTALFGLKTDLQFGKLKVSALASQQESQSQTVSSQGGLQTTRFEIKADQYDGNRHFFLSHYFRNNYEKSMSTLPVISSGTTINRVEVWVTNKRGNFNEARNIVAFMDLAEHQVIDKPIWTPTGTSNLADNSANRLYEAVKNAPLIRDIQQANQYLSGTYPTLNGGEDYEKIESARRLDPSEYEVNQTLGYISLRYALNPDEVLAVAYEYTFNGKTYQVGEFSTDKGIVAPQALILKMLKSSTQSPKLKSWDLMMKNIYAIGASQMQEEAFEMNVMYQNDNVGTQLQYLQAGNITNQLLLRVMNLDRLNKRKVNVPDGKFDYVEGYTAQSNSGRIIFPILEPFGSHLRKKIGNDAVADKYVYQELYDSTLVVAQEYSEKNKFHLVGRYKGSAGNSEIRLNAMNIPRGSVVVTAGGMPLKEGADYSVDYNMGTVTILNKSYLDANSNIDVRLENQSMYNMQRKSLLGTHLEYHFSKNFTLGGTIMYLSEMPLTRKVNTGSEPLKNTIWGINTSWRTESQWLTNMLDKLPFVEASQPSNIALNAEFAQLIPGHSSVIGTQGIAYIDDFESTKTKIDIHYPYGWYLASTPTFFLESKLNNNIDYGKNRALMAWYTVDPIMNGDRRETPSNLRGNVESQSNHLTRAVRETELFPYKDLDPTRSSLLSILNLSYYPKERGPYNLDADRVNPDGSLQNPQDRWGGIMRKLETTDFENANIEYIEFWIMDPFNKDNPDRKGGDLYFNLGDISEDILKDGKKAFENGIPVSGNKAAQMEQTVWGYVPKTQSTVTAFDNSPQNRKLQDVGLNGLSTEEEFTFPTYKNYVDQIRTKVSGGTLTAWQDDPFSPLNDPSGDKYHFYRGSDYDAKGYSILQRYKRYNGTNGNSPATEDTQESYSTSATQIPDIEDINGDNTLNEYEKYFQYKISLRPGDMMVGKNRITDKLVSSVTLKNGKTEDVAWYQFKIPVREFDGNPVGGIRNFKSIRFVRMFLTNFEEETHLRFGTLDLVRGEWKTYTKELFNPTTPPSTNGRLDVLAVNIEENGRKTPVNYILPPGITRETDPSQPQLLQQNEQSMVLRVTDLAPKDSRAVYKNTYFDMRKYKRLQMFVHAAALLDAAAQAQNLQDGDLTCFIRLGSDMKDNYYEYEIPLILTPEGQYSDRNTADREKVWRPENMFDFPFTALTNAKLKRNRERKGGVGNTGYAIPFEVYDPEKTTNKITIKGNPSISDVQDIMVGIRNNSANVKSGEVWVNELRMSEFDENSAWAAMANLNVGLSDLGTVNVSGRTETAGFGGIESNITNRRMDDLYQLNVSATLDLGRFLPAKAKLQIPAYYGYSTETISPKYNPLDEDIILKDALKDLNSKEQDSLKNLTQRVRTVESFNINNAKVDIKSKKPQFYDPANITFSYSSSVTKEHTPEIEQNLIKEQRAGLMYAYSFNNKPWEPFKNVKALKGSALKLIREFNINFLPSSLSYTTNMNRAFSKTKLRSFDTDIKPVTPNVTDLTGLSFSSDFTWNRQFDIQWNLMRELKLGLTTAMNANIEESEYTPEIGEEYYTTWRNTVWQSIKRMGTPYAYQQVFNASYEVPINKLPMLDWVTSNATYRSTYSWNRAAVLKDMPNFGNIASSLSEWSLDGTLNFETLYNKVKYLRDVNKRSQASSQPPRPYQPKKYTQTINLEKGKPLTISHQLGSKKFSITAKDKNGRSITLPYKIKDEGSIEITPNVNIEGVTIDMTGRNLNEKSAGQSVGDFTTRLLMSLRRLSFTYRETSGLVVPGFLNEPGVLGMKRQNGVFSPGFLFVFGYHDDNTLQNFINKDWLYMNTGEGIVNPANEAKTSDLNIRATVEPIPGFKIDLTAQRQTADNKVIQYMYAGMPTTFNGNFNITQIAIATAFDKIGTADQNYSSNTFNTFLDNRRVILDRLQSQMTGRRYPTTGFFAQGESGESLAGKPYDPANGRFSENSPEVLIPAFLSAYTGRDPKKVNTNPFLSLLQILPNWNVTYNGLSNLEFFRNHFRSVSLTHGYTNRYTIGNYTSFSTWVSTESASGNTLGFVRDAQNNLAIPSMAYDISSVSMTESFSPLIGVNIAMKNSVTTKAEYRKQRNLALNLTSVQLIEANADEFVVGIGYVVNDFKLFSRSSKKSTVKNDLKLNADVSYKDIKTLLRKVSENITQASSGNKIISMKVMADYVFSSKVNLQLFFDRQSTIPLISNTFPVSSTNVGLTFRFMLTR